MKKFYFFYSTSSSQSQVLGRVDTDGKISFRGKIILLGNQEKIDKEGHYMAELIEKEKCFIAVRVVGQTPVAREENITEDKYYPQVRYFDEKYLKTKNITTDETEIVYVRGVDSSLIFKMSESMLPYKEEILAYYEEFISSPEKYLGNKIIREVIEPELLFGNTSEYSWGFYRIHKDLVSLCSTDIGVGEIKKVYLFKQSERRVLVPKNILRKKLLRHETGRMAAMGVAAAIGGPRGCDTSNPVEEYIVECENRIVRATVKTSIYWDSNEEDVLEQQELSQKEWENIVVEDKRLLLTEEFKKKSSWVSLEFPREAPWTLVWGSPWVKSNVIKKFEEVKLIYLEKIDHDTDLDFLMENLRLEGERIVSEASAKLTNLLTPWKQAHQKLEETIKNIVVSEVSEEISQISSFLRELNVFICEQEVSKEIINLKTNEIIKLIDNLNGLSKERVYQKQKNEMQKFESAKEQGIPENLYEVFEGDLVRISQFMANVSKIETWRLDEHELTCGRSRAYNTCDSAWKAMGQTSDFFCGADPNDVKYYVDQYHFGGGSEEGYFSDLGSEDSEFESETEVQEPDREISLEDLKKLQEKFRK